MAPKGSGKKGKSGKEYTSIEELLLERERLDKILDSNFRKEVTLVFTDIKGSTQFFESRGDVEGLAMIRRHNEMHFPTIEAHGGRVVKTIGDAIMAAFEDPASAVRATIEMQNNLMYYNKTKQEGDEIHIRIGMNTGVGLIKDEDIFGDVVNLAARVESIADADEILIADSTYKSVKDMDDIICRYHTQASVKGKAEPVRIYRVIWSEEMLVSEAQQMRKTGTRRAAPALTEQEERRAVFELNVSLEGDHLKASAFERMKGEEKTIHHYEDTTISIEEINNLCSAVTATLNRANKRGRVSKEILKKLESQGQMLYDALLPAEAKKRIASTSARDLLVQIDDNLVHIPWELLYDGKSFFCQRFSMGRIVSTRQKVAEGVARHVARPLKMLILADPRGDLKASSEEGIRVRDELEPEIESINANLKNGDIDVDYVKAKLRDFDIVHYAGHADYDTKNPANSGWIVNDGKFTSADISNMTGMKPMPALVFSNGCQSGQTDQWNIGEDYEVQIFGLANAFLLAGVQHYIGTFWDVLDNPSADFALAFYGELMQGRSIGEAVRLARMELIDRYGEDTIVWASYMLYGDPTFTYLGKETEATDSAYTDETQPSRPADLQLVQGEARGAAIADAGPAISQGFQLKASRQNIAIALFAALLVVLGGIYIVRMNSEKTIPIGRGDNLTIPANMATPVDKAYSLLRQGKVEEAKQGFMQLAQSNKAYLGHEGMAALYFETGDTERSLLMIDRALTAKPDLGYARVIRGEILLAANDVDGARDEFLKASKAPGAAEWQKAVAFNNLGRLYASVNDTDMALTSFDKATTLDPSLSDAFSNKGSLLAGLGDFDKARNSFEAGLKANPGDVMAAMLLRDVSYKLALANDREKQEMINKTVAELIKGDRFGRDRKTTPGALDKLDDWTSRPLTITLLGIDQKGILPARQGEVDFILLKLTNDLNESGRAKVVEREIIDKLLGELNLSSSELVDSSTALKVGRILSARFIATGSIIRDGQNVQLTLRVIETETTDIVATLVEIMDGKSTPSQIATRVSELMIAKLRDAFPVHARVDSLKEDKVKLNVGRTVGVKKGMRLAAVDEDGEPVEGVVLIIEKVGDYTATARLEGADKDGITRGTRLTEVIED